MRTFILAVTGFALSVAACSSYGTSVVEVQSTRAAVASVSVSMPRSIVAGQTARAIATVKDANGAALADRTLKWYTSSASIASVTDSGMVSAVAPGDAVLSAVSEGVAGQATLAVIAPPPIPTPVATVLVAITPASVMIGQKALATATLQDSIGNPLSGRPVTWQSSNSNIASVAQTGDVSAVGAGTATITAASEGHTGLAALTVNIPAPIPVASVSVSPASATLQVGGTVQLSAVTRDANNNVLTGRVVAWSSSNASLGTISALGLATAIAAGSVQFTATSEGQTASSTITVSAPVPPPPAPAPVAFVTVSPSTASLQVGGTVQLSAVTRDANNNLLTGRAITWSSTNIGIGRVSSSGVVTAVAAGTAQIRATSEGVSASSALTVAAAPPPPPPPPPPSGGGWRGNEPTGMTQLTDRAFNSTVPTWALSENGWWDNSSRTGFTIVADATAPQSPSNVGQFMFPAGFPTGVSPASVEYGTLGEIGTRTLYASMYVKYSSNWQGNRDINKIIYMGGGRIVISTVGGGSAPLLAQIFLQGVLAGGNYDAGATGVYTSSIALARGQWHLLEIVATSNTGSNRDGSISLYVNGVLATSCSSIAFASGSPRLGPFSINPVYGGGGNPVASDQTLRVDQVYLSGKN